jgi:D-ribulokinase
MSSASTSVRVAHAQGVFDLRDGCWRPPSVRHHALSRGRGIVEQSSDRDLAAVCTSVREAVAAAGVDAGIRRGMGFDATCSLVVPSRAMRLRSQWALRMIRPQYHRLDGSSRGRSGRAHQRRGSRCSALCRRPHFARNGNAEASLAEGIPPQSFAAAWHFFDLADYLTWRATGSIWRDRSAPSPASGPTSRTSNAGTPAISRRSVSESWRRKDFPRIGTDIVDPGTPLGKGLTERAAAAIGLPAGTLSERMIDAHAGGIGTGGIEAGTARMSQPACLRVRNVVLHDDLERQSGVRGWRLGTLLLGDGAGAVA